MTNACHHWKCWECVKPVHQLHLLCFIVRMSKECGCSSCIVPIVAMCTCVNVFSIADGRTTLKKQRQSWSPLWKIAQRRLPRHLCQKCKLEASCCLLLRLWCVSCSSLAFILRLQRPVLCCISATSNCDSII